MTPYRSPRFVLLAALFAVLFFVGHVGALAHELATQHVTCAEHGETVDVGRVVGAALPGTSQVTEPASSEGRCAHEHCAFAVIGTHRAARPDTVVAAVTNVVVAVDLQPDQRRIVTAPRHRRYRLAPKTSPPA